MCGIFGYIGKHDNAPELVIKGLKTLEYRGYDSWGIAYNTNDKLCFEKQIGKVSNAEIHTNNIRSHCAIGHTRWATHGGVEIRNAHPHFSSDKSIAVIHNGIIENYTELKSELVEKGYAFVSDTDTEVVPHLVDSYCKQGQTFIEAFLTTCRTLKGRYALVAIHSEENIIITARNGSPVIIGVGNNEWFIASDISAFLEYTTTVNYLDDGQACICDGKSAVYVDLNNGNEQIKRNVTISVTEQSAEKGEYAHFMLKEIMEQKVSIGRAANQPEEEIRIIAQAIRNAKGTFIVGCGTAGKACMAAEYFFSVVAEHHVNFAPASEFTLYHHFLTSESLLIVVSQSGETADVLEAMNVAKSKGAKVLAIVNVEGSTIHREADYTLLINAGPEKAVASTKALTGQLAVLLSIAYALCDYPRDRRLTHSLHDGKTLLHTTSSQIAEMLNPRYIEHIQSVAKCIAAKTDMYIIGKSWNFPMALESAIKIQEVSYIHAEGFAGGELKHGPLALIEHGTPCIALLGNDEVMNDTLNNVREIKARGAFTIGISPINNDVFDIWIKVPDAGNAQAIVNILPIQILSYFLAIERGTNPDMPRNLAKSVTVK